ncbi:RT0821/Lpp0805 family surface protein [Methylocella sp.]|uniref:RT0821/Lpp0805 family surface protein n=1 Tax=Methylocella sp. TaxID=1978226 RepID=UPI0035B33933
MKWLSGHYHRSGFASSAARAARGLPAVALAASLLSGCAFTMQVARFSTDNDDVTGSIEPSPLDSLLDAEDWRRARAALSTALDPQGNGAEVAWDNPQSGAKGVFAPLAPPYPDDGKVCRAFRAQAKAGDASRRVEGVACADKNGDWTIARSRETKRA